jgi:hypothetical protein
MATAPIQLSPTIRRLAESLDASSVECRRAATGDLIAEMHAMGQIFTFSVSPEGRVTGRTCRGEHDTLLTRPEMQAVRDLVQLELAKLPNGHLRPEAHNREVVAALGRAEIKFTLTLNRADELTGFEARVLTDALERYVHALTGQCMDPGLRGETRAAVSSLHRKLGV